MFCFGCMLVCLLGTFSKVLGGVRPESELLKHLMSNYDKRFLPVSNPTDSVELAMSYSLINIADMDEENGIITVRGWLHMEWLDNFLVWDPEKWHGVEELHLTPSEGEYWTPDIKMYNGLEEHLDYTIPATIYSDGVISYIPPITHKVQCLPVDHELPHARFLCPLKLGSWTYNGNDMHITSYYEMDSLDLVDFSENPAWELVEHDAELETTYYDCCPDTPYQSLNMNLTVQQREVP